MTELREKVEEAIYDHEARISSRSAARIADRILEIPEIRAGLTLLNDSRERLGVVDMPTRA